MNTKFLKIIKIISVCALMTIFIPCCICGCSEKNESYAAPATETSIFANEQNSSSMLQSHSEISSSVDPPNVNSSSISSSVSEPHSQESKETNGNTNSWLNELLGGNSHNDNKDTDNDKLIDSDEIVLGLDPNNPQTFGTPDAEYKVKQTIAADSKSLSKVNIENSPYTLSLEITAAGNVNRTLTAGKSSYSNVIDSDIQLGNTIDLKYTGGDISEVKLNFTISDEYLDNELNLYPEEKELQGIRRFNIFKYFEDINMLLPIETTIDEETKTISATVDELGTYCVVDMEKWLYNLSEFLEDSSAG